MSVTAIAPSTEATYQQACELLAQRLSGYRLEHSHSVAATAAVLAEAYGADVEQARLAGLLHDWDKGLSNEELIAKAKFYALDLDDQPWDSVLFMLHGATAAASLAEDFENLDPAIIQAIARHTAPAADMSDLDMIVYLADEIEPLRGMSEPGQLREQVGLLSLRELFVRGLELTLISVLREHKPLWPASLEIWNRYIMQEDTTDDLEDV